jgi:predicted ester cyclase
VFSGRAQATLHHEQLVARGNYRVVARGTYRASVMGEPPIGRNLVFSGVKIFRIADGTIVERWRRERSSRSRARSQTCGSRTRLR